MSDLELTRLCAEAAGISPFGPADTPNGERWLTGVVGEVYDPLHDDAQAMQLVKKMRVVCVTDDKEIWHVQQSVGAPFDGSGCAHSMDLNRAIVECVSKMWRTKSAQPPSETPDSLASS